MDEFDLAFSAGFQAGTRAARALFVEGAPAVDYNAELVAAKGRQACAPQSAVVKLRAACPYRYRVTDEACPMCDGTCEGVCP